MNNYNFDIVDSDGFLFMTITVRNNTYTEAEKTVIPVLQSINANEIIENGKDARQFFIDTRKELEFAE